MVNCRKNNLLSQMNSVIDKLIQKVKRLRQKNTCHEKERAEKLGAVN